jgi:hypothetical protein
MRGQDAVAPATENCRPLPSPANRSSLQRGGGHYLRVVKGKGQFNILQSPDLDVSRCPINEPKIVA